LFIRTAQGYCHTAHAIRFYSLPGNVAKYYEPRFPKEKDRYSFSPWSALSVCSERKWVWTMDDITANAVITTCITAFYPPPLKSGLTMDMAIVKAAKILFNSTSGMVW